MGRGERERQRERGESGRERERERWRKRDKGKGDQCSKIKLGNPQVKCYKAKERSPYLFNAGV